MDIVITDWALDSYLDLFHRGVFTKQEYWDRLRPDVELLQSFPASRRFQDANFWGPATDKSGSTVPHGFKMKWHNIGPGRIQLRVSIALWNGRFYLCRGWVKDSPATDKREAANLKRHINVIANGQHTERGTL